MSERLPRVTVLMPVYNGASYLVESVRSILNQTFSDFEFLIIDDGSTDESIEIIQGMSDPRIRLIHNGANLGLVTSLNRGFELAQGEFIARMDADDISLPERLACQVDFMVANPMVGVCGSWVKIFSASGSSVWKLPQSSVEIRCWQFHTVGVAHPSVMLRRRFFTEHRLFYDPEYRHIEDYELWGRAIQYMDFANIPKVLLEYRKYPGQICAEYSEEQLERVAPLRVNHVRELGIEPTADEQTLHEMVMNNRLPTDKAFLDYAERWLMRLDSANRVSGTYHANLFTRRLLDIWFSVCMSLADTSVCSGRRCITSQLWSAAQNSTRLRVRALGAWLVQRVAPVAIREN